MSVKIRVSATRLSGDGGRKKRKKCIDENSHAENTEQKVLYNQAHR
jgi:hypothetical protein